MDISAKKNKINKFHLRLRRAGKRERIALHPFLWLEPIVLMSAYSRPKLNKQ